MKTEKRYHITIKDNSTGESLVDIDSNAIIASYDEDGTTHKTAATHCSPFDLACTIRAAEEVCEDLREQKPEIDALMKLLDIIDK